jgi:hypothetical protein
VVSPDDPGCRKHRKHHEENMQIPLRAVVVNSFFFLPWSKPESIIRPHGVTRRIKMLAKTKTREHFPAA